MKTKIIIFTLFLCGLIFAQEYKEVLPPENIRSVQLFNPQTNDQNPIIRMGREYLILSFDDFNLGFHEYNYKIEHYNADWTPSGIFNSEFIDGYSSNYIRDYQTSFNTYQQYTHYELTIPNRDMGLKLPGNYVIKIYTDDENKPVFTRRFAIYEEGRVSVGIRSERAIGSGDFNQKISVIASSSQMDLTQTPDGATLFIMKNGNWEDNLVLKRPQFIKPTQLTYQDMNHLFEGGSEYLWFDTKRRNVATMNTESIFRQDSLYAAVLRPNTPLRNIGYFDNPDVNGTFYIRNADLLDQNRSRTEADYIWTYFALDKFDDAGGTRELYLVGAFNNWQLAPEYRLFKTESNYWEVGVLLKQGYYNYLYAVYDRTTGKVSYTEIDGSFWETENLYQALFYYRPWGVRYDVLVGYGETNSRN